MSKLTQARAGVPKALSQTEKIEMRVSQNRTQPLKDQAVLVQHPVRRATSEVLNGKPLAIRDELKPKVKANVARFRKFMKDAGLT